MSKTFTTSPILKFFDGSQMPIATTMIAEAKPSAWLTLSKETLRSTELVLFNLGQLMCKAFGKSLVTRTFYL